MHFYIAIEGEKRGPYSAFRIIDQLRDGEVSPDVLGWEPGMEAWVKLREIPAFADSIEAMETEPDSDDEKSDETGSSKVIVAKTDVAKAAPVVPDLKIADQKRPFLRFWARAFDYMLVSAVAWQFCDVPPLPEHITPADILKNDGSIIPQDALIEMAKIHYAALLIWQFIEGALMHLFGTTPGKALFNIRITAADGSLLPLVKGFGRSFFVWVVGFGMGLFPFNLIGMGIGIAMLMFTGATLWDRQLQARVHHGPMTTPRILVAIGGFFLLMIISSLKFS